MKIMGDQNKKNFSVLRPKFLISSTLLSHSFRSYVFTLSQRSSSPEKYLDESLIVQPTQLFNPKLSCDKFSFSSFQNTFYFFSLVWS